MKRKKVSMLLVAAAAAAMTVNPVVAMAEETDAFGDAVTSVVDDGAGTTDGADAGFSGDWAETWDAGTSTGDGIDVYDGSGEVSGDSSAAIADPWGDAGAAQDVQDDVTDAETAPSTVTGESTYTYQTYTATPDPYATGSAPAATEAEETADAMDITFHANEGTFEGGEEDHVVKSDDWTLETGEVVSGQFEADSAAENTDAQDADVSGVADPLADFGSGSALFTANATGALRYVYVSAMWDLKEGQSIQLTDKDGNELLSVDDSMDSHNLAIVLDEIPNVTINKGDEEEINYKISWTAAYGAGEGEYLIPERDGYEFTGWFIDDVSISAWTGDLRENVYAGWEALDGHTDASFITASMRAYAAASGDSVGDELASMLTTAAAAEISDGEPAADQSSDEDTQAAGSDQSVSTVDVADTTITAPSASTQNAAENSAKDDDNAAVAAYTVQHMLMDTDGKNYTVKDTEHLTAAAGTTVSPSVKSYTGFNSPNIQSATVAADGSTVIDYRYPRQTFNFALTQIDGADLSGSTPSGSKYYGETITLKCVAASGYEFDKWSNGDTQASTSFVMPAEDVTITPSVKTAGYKITYNLDGGTANNPETYTSDTESFVLEQPTKDGFIFAGWTGANGSTPQTSVTIGKGTAGNLTFNANWVANGSTTPESETSTEADGVTVKNVQTGDTNQPILYAVIAACAAACVAILAVLKKRKAAKKN